MISATNLIQFVRMEADPRLAHSAMPCEVVGGRVAVFDENVAPLPVFLSEMRSTKYYKLSCVIENCASVDSRFLPSHALRRQGAFDDARKRT